ncbi:tetratricopeptide repeat protein, partial [Myxococcota bacterium]|nr:tetratricopeptide repeat protein [Myxococcota bacterium]
IFLSQGDKNEIIVSSQIYAAAKYNWDLEEMPADFDIKKYRLVGRKDKVDRIKSRTAVNMVGVDFEMDRLRRTYFRALERERMEHLVVLGEMGVGKSSLFQSFIDELDDKAQIIRAEARPYHSAIPFSMIINFIKDMLRGQFGQAETNITENLSKYLKGVIEDPVAHQKVIDALKPLLDAESDSTKGANIGQMVGRALEITLRDMAKNKPVIAVFEDVQWSDEQSKLILHYFVTNEKLKGRVFFLFSGRDEENFPSGFFVKPPLVMGNMDSSMARKFVEGHFLNAESAQNMINEIVKRGEGNPFFLKELINSTIDLGFCQAQDEYGGKLILTRSGPEQPDLGMSSPTLEGIITSRLDSLDHNLRRVLRLAAVFGRSFSKELLNQLINEDSSDFLEQLIKRRVIKRHGESNKYSFIQQIVRDFAYKGLPDEIKRQAHLEVAKIKLESPAYHAAHDDPVIAAHFEQGGDRKSAAKHYLSAAHHARKLASNTEAERHYQKVLELVSEDKELVFHAHKDLEVIYHNLGARDGQMKHISNMQTLAEEEGNDQWKAIALCRRMAYYQGIGEPNKTLELFDRVITVAQRCEDYYCQADAHRILARAKLDLGEIEEALRVVDKGVSIVEKRPEISSIMADLFHIRGNALFYRGKMDQAIETYLKALEMFREEHKRTQESTILMNLGFLSSIYGDYDKAIGYYKKAYDIDLEKGDKINTGIKLANLAQTHIELGNYSSAKRLLREARKLCEHTRDTGALSDTTLTLAQLKIRQGEYVEAMRHIQTGIEYALSAKSRIDEIRGLLLWAECQLEDPDGNYQRALEKSSEAISLSEKAKLPDGLIHGLILKARALLMLEKPEEAVHYSAQAVAFTTVSKIQGVDTIYHTHGLVMKALKEPYFAQLFILKAFDEIHRKVSLMGHEKQKQRYLSVKPASDILRDYKKFDAK